MDPDHDRAAQAATDAMNDVVAAALRVVVSVWTDNEDGWQAEAEALAHAALAFTDTINALPANAQPAGWPRPSI